MEDKKHLPSVLSKDFPWAEESYESMVLLRASWIVAGLDWEEMFLRYRQKSEYCTFLVYANKVVPKTKFAKDYVFIAHRKTCNQKILRMTECVRGGAGHGVVIPSTKAVEPGFITGLSLDEVAIYMRALCLCLKEKGEIPSGQNSSFRKQVIHIDGRDALLLLVVNSVNDEPVGKIPRALVFVEDMSPDAQEFVAGMEEV